MAIVDKKVFALIGVSKRQSLAVRFGVTIGMVVVSCAVRWALGDFAGPYGFILFVPAVVLTSLLYGQRFGLLALAASTIFNGLSLDWHTPHFHVAALATFVVVGIGLVLLGDALRRALDALNEARKENEILLNEMSHRVKNKFATIISVIALQSRSAPLEARPALDAVAQRVRSLAALHTHLQLSRHRGLVNMKAYLTDLCQGLDHSVGHMRKITVPITCEQVFFPPRDATAVGLIVNELVMNGYKYAFPDQRAGTIAVDLARAGTSFELTVADDGIGRPSEARDGMGSGLVTLLASQLGGSPRWTRPAAGGCTVVVTFPATPDMRSDSDGLALLKND